MIDIKEALYNILHSRYGRDVRQSIHDGIYQINENANEAIDLAQIKFGTAVNSPTDPITGYIENSLYLNVNTNIMWKLEGGLWVKKGTFKSIDNISLLSTSGTIDTYKITFTDGSISNFNVTNGTDGADGKSITGITKTSTSGNVDHYDVNLSDGTTTSGFDVTNGTNGADGKSIANISLASTSGNVKNYDVFLDDGTKTPTGFSVEDGASSYLHIRYSSSFDGTGMVTTPTDATVYIGILVSTSSVAPTNPSYYNWVRFIGKSGTGSGDMLSTDYATKYPNTVDKAAALYDGSNEILPNQLMQKSVYDADNDGVVDNAKNAVNADNVGNVDTSLLEKLSDSSGKLNYNGNALMLEAAQFANQAKLGEFVVNQKSNNVKELALHSNITTKLSKVDTTDNLSVELAKKIDKPASATDGQVLTYNGTSKVWEAQAPKGGSITEPTNLEKGIIGGDEWTAKSYTKGSTVIYNNKIYSCIADCGASILPTDTTYWEETSISKLKGAINEVNSSLGVDITNEFVVGSNCKYFKATYYPEDSIVNIKAFSNNISVANGYKIATPSTIHVAKENSYSVLKGFRVVGGNIAVRDLCLLNPLNFNLYGTSDGNTTSFQIEFDYFVN